jgi:hypothetical protein
MRAHQPGSTPIDIPETVPNPAHTPTPAPAPERAPTKVPDKVPEKVIAPASFDAFFRPGLGHPRACCRIRLVLGSTPLQGCLWPPRSAPEADSEIKNEERERGHARLIYILRTKRTLRR